MAKSLLASLAIAFLFLEAARVQAQEHCVFDLGPVEEPYYVLGSLVVPQSNSVAVASAQKRSTR